MNVEVLFSGFAQKKVLVVGDVMIDAYLRGKVSRISPEAPVPIISLEKSDQRLGGAANVALNLLALGATPILCATVGKDNGGKIFSELLKKRGLTDKGIIYTKDKSTTIKTRVIGDNQHLLRIDDEMTSALTENEENELIDRVTSILKEGVDAIILEDYNKGLLTNRVIEQIISLAKNHSVIVAVDPKKENFFAYKGVTLFKPNLKELKEGLNIDEDLMSNRDAFTKAIDRLEKELGNEISFVTLSEHGVFIKKEDDVNFVGAHIRKIADVSGAGDTVISVATLCLASGLSIREVAEIANLSGGLVCEVSGVVPIDKEQLKQEVLKLSLK